MAIKETEDPRILGFCDGYYKSEKQIRECKRVVSYAAVRECIKAKSDEEYKRKGKFWKMAERMGEYREYWYHFACAGMVRARLAGRPFEDPMFPEPEPEHGIVWILRNTKKGVRSDGE